MISHTFILSYRDFSLSDNSHCKIECRGILCSSRGAIVVTKVVEVVVAIVVIVVTKVVEVIVAIVVTKVVEFVVAIVATKVVEFVKFSYAPSSPKSRIAFGVAVV